MHLVKQGLINISAPVFGTNGILTDSTLQVLDPRVNNITVRDLLNHSGGWNSSISGDPMFNSYNIANTMGISPPANAETVIKYVLSRKMLDLAPSTQYQNSNFGYSILGRVIEKVTGQDYDEYVKNNIFNLVNINDMELGNNLSQNTLSNEDSYYNYPNAPSALSVYNNTSLVPWPYGGFNLEAMDAHGAWVASAEDL